MNIKSKMPKFGHKLNGSGMVRELLMTILGTTISIVLTFGTAHFLELRQADKARRQTAMMLIHDIDESIATLESMAENEEEQKAAIQYVIDHLDQIESLPSNTIYTAVTMLGVYFSDGDYFDDSKEKVFNSSQETWKNLDDVSFVDNMEEFYVSRNYLEAVLIRSPQWKYPMSQEEFHELAVKIGGNIQSPLKVYADVLKEKLKDPKIRYYIDNSAYRARTLRRYAQSWKNLSERNKFIMDIEDEELAEYVKKSQRSGQVVGHDDIIGHWEYEMSGKDVQYYDFMKPDSFSIKTKQHYGNPFYSGDIIVTYMYSGQWYIKGDSLMLNYSPESVKAEVDRSGVTYRAEMKDSVESFIGRYFTIERLEKLGRKRMESRQDTFALSINKSGNKIELVRGQGEDAEGASYLYIKRSKNSNK